jgi:hypothetical protein
MGILDGPIWDDGTTKHGHEHTLKLFAAMRIQQLKNTVEEERRRHEAEIRAKDEAIGELLGVIDMHPAELASVLAWTYGP